MSLRDQLLKSGLANKKQVAAANRSLRKKRKKSQSERERKAIIASREEELTLQRNEQRKAESRKRRKESEARREEANHGRLVSNLIRSYGKDLPEGRQPFFHRQPMGNGLNRLHLPIEIALELRAGKSGIAWTGKESEPRFLLLSGEIVRRILTHDPGRIVFFNDEAPDPNDASERLSGFERLPGERDRPRVGHRSFGHSTTPDR